MIRQRRQVVVLAEHDSGNVPWYHEAYAGIAPGDQLQLADGGADHRPGQLAGELRAEPRRHDRRRCS